VILAEDNYLVREGTRRLLEAVGEIDIIAAVGSATELVDAVARLAPDAVITDIRMPPDDHMAGIEAARQIRATTPEVGVVVLSQYDDSAYAMELLRDGARGVAYLLKDRIGDFEELVRALREVVAGRSVLDPLGCGGTGGAASEGGSVATGPANRPGAGRAARNGPGPQQRRHRPGAHPFRVGGREARQRDLHQARAGPGAAAAPPSECGGHVPTRRRPPGRCVTSPRYQKSTRFPPCARSSVLGWNRRLPDLPDHPLPRWLARNLRHPVTTTQPTRAAAALVGESPTRNWPGDHAAGHRPVRAACGVRHRNGPTTP
jgi:CheY-like chemotaxis protein